MRWPFAKYTGCGNDFILFDNRLGAFPKGGTLIQRLCHRQTGIGADGVLLLENSAKADFLLQIFNSDGSQAEMCGNGLRCFVKWLQSLGFHNPSYTIEISDFILNAIQKENDVCIEMGSPRNVQWDISLRIENQFHRVHYVDTGVPHVVLFFEDVENFNFVKLGNYIRNYSLWSPKGTNVTITQLIHQQKLKIRTYERGVEGETLACGTGGTAAALAAARLYQLLSPVIIETRSGDELIIDFSYENQKFSDVTLTGPAKRIFSGDIELGQF